MTGGFVVFSPPDPTPQTAPPISIGSAVLHSSRQSVVGLVSSRGESGPIYNTWFLGPADDAFQTVAWSVQPFFRAHDRDRPTTRLGL